jgi:opacity protein-like surface antigen
MKRLLVIACMAVLSAGAVAGPALAKTVKDFAGSVERGGRVKFSAVREQGRYTDAGLFHFQSIPVMCKQGRTRIFFSNKHGVDVRQRRFSYRFHFGGDGGARVRGAFNKRGTRAHGTVNVWLFRERRGGDHTRCTTNGRRQWTAVRKG